MVDEELYHVDEFDNVLGSILRSTAHRPDRGVIHRTVHILLREDNGRVILQKRNKPQGLNHLCWTSTASGHVKYHDTYEQAAHAELIEETDSRLAVVDLVKVAALSLQARNDHEFCNARTTIFAGTSPFHASELEGTDREAVCFAAFPPRDILDATRNGKELVDPQGERVQFADNFRSVIEAYLEWLPAA